LRQLDLELRPQLPLLSVRYETFKCSPVRRGRKKTHPQVVVFAVCWPFCGAQSSVLSLFYHGRVGQEPVTDGHSSVDEFWESCCSFRLPYLLRAGWYPVYVRPHPDCSLL
ncbi:hypothetical protein PFLUV_G00163480, partial [Perca fluviatilis]